MEYYESENFSLQGTCVAFGSFDGVHLGHRAIVAAMLRHTDEQSVVLSFAPCEGKVLYTETEKKILLEELGVHTMISYPAEKAAEMEPETFIKEVLVKGLGVRTVVVGEGFTFGKNGAGTVQLLQEKGKANGFAVEVCDTVKLEGETVSAEAIRAAFDAMDFKKATELFGHTYIMYGFVEHGKAEGRTVGMPTANLGVSKMKQFPPHGVYATLSDFDGVKHRGLTNIGLRPSADTMPKATIETFILNFSGDLYDKPILLEVHLYIRGVIKFKNLTEVKEQVNKDIARVHEYLQQIGE